MIDTHVPLTETALFEAVISVGASIATSQRPRDSILDVIFAGEDIIQLSEGRGLGDAALALTFLAEAQPSRVDDFERIAETMLTRAPELASVILIFGQWDKPRRELVEQLAAQGIPSLSILLNTNSESSSSVREFGAHRQFSVRASALAEDLAQVVPAQ